MPERVPDAQPRTVFSALIVVQLLFASNPIAAKIALREVSPRGLVAFRVGVAALVLLAVRALRPWHRVPPRDLPALAAYSLLGVVANQLLFMEGLRRSTATNAVVLGTTIPVFTVAVALLLRRESATPRKLLGLGVALFGALSVVGLQRFEGSHVAGDLLFLSNSICYALYMVLSRPLLVRLDTATVMTWVFGLGVLGTLPFGGRELARGGLSAGTQAALAYIALGPTVLAYFLNAYALRRASASTVAIFIYVQPVVGALLAALLLHERPAAATLLGGALIAAGIWLVTAPPLTGGRAAPA